MLEPQDSKVYTSTVPALRRGAEEHASLATKYWMPKLIVRRDGDNLHNRFVALWDPYMDAEAVTKVTKLAPDDPDIVALNISVRLQVVKVGNLRIAAIPAETFVEIGLELKQHRPDFFAVSLANGYFGYLPTVQHPAGRL